MKAELKQETVFTVKVVGLEFPGMRVTSRWNRLTELTNADGEKLIISGEAPSGFAGAFLEIFGDVFGGGARKKDDIAVLMGSHALMKQINEAALAAAPAPI